jgi:hypothetical protein
VLPLMHPGWVPIGRLDSRSASSRIWPRRTTTGAGLLKS